MDRVRALVAIAAGLAVAGCRARAQAMQSQADVERLVRLLVPQVERATGLKFRRSVAVLLRSRDQVRDYVVRKSDQDLPPAELAGAEAAYKLFGLIPDSLDLRRALVNLLTEQVAGYYDPDSAALFIPTDVTDTAQVRIVVSHELVHALQDQYVPLDSLITQRRENDRRSAAQAVLEGQAVFYQIGILMPEQDPDSFPEHYFWTQRAVLGRLQSQMKEFGNAPVWLRETLVFPYLGGADFIGWFRRTYPGKEPYGAAMPTSTEQILHPDRYAAHDEPVSLRFGSAPDTVRYTDDLGELETGLLFVTLLADTAEQTAPQFAVGWGGDRYEVLGPKADALVWCSVWDSPAAADHFAGALRRAWARRGRPGRTSRIERLDVSGHAGVRLVDAPTGWKGWARLPTARVAP